MIFSYRHIFPITPHCVDLVLKVREQIFPFWCLCPGRPCFSSSDVFCFAFLSISLLASVFPVSLPLFFLFLRPCLSHARMPDWGRAFVHGHTFLHSWTHFLAFMEWADDIGSRPAAWSHAPVRSSSCFLRVFYKTLAVGKDTY